MMFRGVVARTLFLGGVLWSATVFSGYDYKRVGDFEDFIERNTLPGTDSKTERLPTPGSFIDVDVVIKEKPVPGQFSIVYFMMQGMQYDPVDITHSVFISAGQGPVLNAYSTPQAAADLSEAGVGKSVRIKAIHLYNFPRGPRLVIMSVSPGGD